MTHSALSSFSPFFEPRSRPARLPPAEAQRLFEERHAPAIRRVVERRGPSLKRADLLDRHDLGLGLNFVQDHQLHRGGARTAAAYLIERCGLSAGTHSGLPLCGHMAAGLLRTWIEEAPGPLPLEAAAEIGRDDPLLVGWVRRLLYREGLGLHWLRKPETMRRVVSEFKEHLRRWPEDARGPAEDEVLSWIDRIGRGRPLQAPLGRNVEERKIPREADPEADADKRATVARRLDALEHGMAQILAVVTGYPAGNPAAAAGNPVLAGAEPQWRELTGAVSGVHLAGSTVAGIAGRSNCTGPAPIRGFAGSVGGMEHAASTSSATDHGWRVRPRAMAGVMRSDSWMWQKL